MSWLERPSRSMSFANREGIEPYDFTLRRSHARRGVSAMVRVKNEGAKLSHCLRSILPVFNEIVLVDNRSDDGTLEIAHGIKEHHDPRGKLRVFSYPYKLARFGPEHDATPEDSIHSAVYFTNWSLSHCTRRYACKWDGDMVLRREARRSFRAFLRRIQVRKRRCWTLAGQTVYRDARGEFLLARGEVNREIEVFPCGFECRFVKSEHWELLTRPPEMRVGDFSPVCFYELKFVDEAEFSHWSTTEWPSERKQREWDNFHRVKSGRVDADGFHRLGSTFLDDQIS